MSRRDAESLLGAWAVDAVDADERAAIDAILATDARLDRRAAAMQAAASHLAAEVAPPAALRGRVLAAAEAARGGPRGVPSTPPLELYRRQAALLDALAGELTAADWSAPVPPYDADPLRWTVHDLVAHLAAVDRLMAATLGLADPPDHAGAGHLEVGRDLIAAERTRRPADTLAEWRRHVDLVADHLGGPGAPDPTDPMPLHGWPFDVGSLLVARAFEMWTHADDIRRVTGRPVVAPSPPDVHTMSDFSVTSIAQVLPLLPDAGEVGRARVVLTGEGGGTWDLDTAGAGEPVVLVADAVDYCRMAARRIDPADLDLVVEGGRGAVGPLLAAARVFAV